MQNEAVDWLLYIFFISPKGFSIKQNITPKMKPIKPSTIIIKNGAVDSNSKRYLSIISIIAKSKYSIKSKTKAKVNSL